MREYLNIETLHKLAKANRMLSQKLGREPTDAELAEEMGMDERKICEIQKISHEPTSFDSTLGEDEDTKYGDLKPEFDNYEIYRKGN